MLLYHSMPVEWTTGHSLQQLSLQVNKWAYWAYELCFCAFFFCLAWLALAFKQHQKR